MSPNSTIPTITKVVVIGRRMKSSEILCRSLVAAPDLDLVSFSSLHQIQV